MVFKGMVRPETGRLTTGAVIGSATSDPVATRRFVFSFYYRFYFSSPSAEEV